MNATLRQEGHSFRVAAHEAGAIPSKLFTVYRDSSAAGARLYADLSDLEAAGFNPFLALYDDACDVGFTLSSDRTGAMVVYFLAQEIRESESEDLSWVFEPTEASIRRVPAARGTTVTIVND